MLIITLHPCMCPFRLTTSCPNIIINALPPLFGIMLHQNSFHIAAWAELSLIQVGFWSSFTKRREKQHWYTYAVWTFMLDTVNMLMVFVLDNAYNILLAWRISDFIICHDIMIWVSDFFFALWNKQTNTIMTTVGLILFCKLPWNK